MGRHTLHHLTPHVAWLSPDGSVDRPTLGVVHGSQHTLIVDSGNSPAHANTLLSVLDEHQIARPSFAMLTHWHWDHVFGSSVFQVPTFASTETQRIVRILAQLDWSDRALDARVARGSEIAFCRDMIKRELPERSNLPLRIPDISFSRNITISLGDISCVIEHIGGDHAHDSSVVFVPEERIVFMGDALYDDIYHGPYRMTRALLYPLLEKLKSYEADYYIGSHDSEPTSKAEFLEQAETLITIGDIVAANSEEREDILALVPKALNQALTNDHVEIVDSFLAGIRLPTVASIW
jgi:glyoxylase-like metal-dependent hydrolase (beta-lactamase superfamily II)